MSGIPRFDRDPFEVGEAGLSGWFFFFGGGGAFFCEEKSEKTPEI